MVTAENNYFVFKDLRVAPARVDLPHQLRLKPHASSKKYRPRKRAI
jgi:hypothetical protein